MFAGHVFVEGFMIFPTVSGTALSGQLHTLPFSLRGEFNIVVLAFEVVHQLLVQTWMSALEDLQDLYPRLAFYEVPTLWPYSEEQRLIIDMGMRQAVANPLLEDHVIPLYVDKGLFRQLLDLPTENTIYLLLIDREGEVFWRTTGELTQEKLESLIRTLDRVFDADNERL